MGFDLYGMNPKIGEVKRPERPTDAVLYDSQDKGPRDEYFKKLEAYEGANPGSYFRRNVWGWRPLWQFACAIAEDILDDQDEQSGGFNDCHEIEAEKAVALADRLAEAIGNGMLDEYLETERKELSEIPLRPCPRCTGSGWEPDSSMEEGEDECVTCNGQGHMPAMATYYRFGVEDVQAFEIFCRESGGFEIC
tara:strand:+ start:2292 stop:2870 length:579 start_codon:yes stop_codon:yes gene_type:complete